MQVDNRVRIYVDGATASQNHCGIAAIARLADGCFLGWASRQLPAMTNNEAEYQAVLLGIELARRLGLNDVTFVSDSEVVVWQMRGHSRVMSPRLRPLHRQVCAEARGFTRITFEHVLREHNELADALATEALRGQVVQLPPLPGHWLSRLRWPRTMPDKR